MSSTKAYAALDTTSPLVPYTIERRDPKPHDVQIQILFCGVCHSDLHFVKNDWGMSTYPLVPGHEIVGKVTAVGDHVKKFKVGDLAGIGCLVDSCRDCDNCKEGLEQYCTNGWVGTYGGQEKDGSGATHGGYSKSILAHEDFVLKISEKLDLAAAAPLLCAGITTYSPLKHWKIGKGSRVGVLGLGGLGHMGVKIAVAMGAEVTMLSHTASKEADAKRLGAHQFVLTSDAEQVKKVTGYFDFILDTVSADHDYNSYLALLRSSGTMVCVGLPTTPAQIPMFNLVFGRKSIAGSLIGGLPETQEMLDFCAEHNIVSDIEIIAMKDINTAYERLEKSDVKYRFVIDMATL
ncbi:MAG: NAD(P)-dependent alcohol dehydrogenase [Chitinophagaceae bacterium]|nr:NAD(P)-dependent alcohol dehydrogenase [Chitinophagaceae bacterium]MBK8606530.1 NAD(P)-dependent alcohol dehydrogenase [Chitinophagaceae bacterium]MBP6476171.1 NAD(P)-dependent alcohol dehydrogenase [Chitinophagaceae bacterium]MBP7107196.1 NAD(P)-dependent alcohol dehydrogenase [Chitinophagaceae bacterium]MBP7313602.1 NAD(P)-dependent alcohol dehydrogenase [Chitinophagaceae bacterium]